MLNIIFDKPRYMVRAVASLFAIQGLIFANIEKSPLATTLIIVGTLGDVGAHYVELLSLAKLAFRILNRAIHSLRMVIERATERWASQVEVRARQYRLAVAEARNSE